MHIPDGYLSPETAGAMYVATAPFLWRATRVVKKALQQKFVSLISVFSALSFLIMMFNIPLPGGTTGHAVGAVIAAIILGPWAGMLAITMALIIQALFFGDGGILALGANVFNIGVAMSLIGYGVYKLLSKTFLAKKIAIISAIAGYVAINVAALLTAIELGIQPLLFTDVSGRALYFPYGLNVAVPAMLLGHLTIAGLAEALITGLVIGWIKRTQPQLLPEKTLKESPKNSFKWSWYFVLLLVFLTPVGLLAPGTAWGEWGREELVRLGLGFVPAGFDKWASVWRSPFPDYTHGIFSNSTTAYIFSAALGVVLIWSVTFILAWVIRVFAKSQRTSS